MVLETSGALFGACCKDPASKHLASPPISASESCMTGVGDGRRGRASDAASLEARPRNDEGPARHPPLGGFRTGPIVRKDPRPCTWHGVDSRMTESMSTTFWGFGTCVP